MTWPQADAPPPPKPPPGKNSADGHFPDGFRMSSKPLRYEGAVSLNDLPPRPDEPPLAMDSDPLAAEAERQALARIRARVHTELRRLNLWRKLKPFAIVALGFAILAARYALHQNGY